MFILLQDLQRILVDESLGDQSTPELLETARRLSHQLVPAHWVTAVGPSAPPENYPLHLWIKVYLNTSLNKMFKCAIYVIDHSSALLLH